MADGAHSCFPSLPAHDSLGYSQQTVGIAELTLNLAFRWLVANVSTIIGAAEYTLHNQLICTLTSSLCKPDNA